MQVSPSGMAAASQAVPGEFDSRHLLQKTTSFDKKLVVFYPRRVCDLVANRTKCVCYQANRSYSIITP